MKTSVRTLQLGSVSPRHVNNILSLKIIPIWYEKCTPSIHATSLQKCWLIIAIIFTLRHSVTFFQVGHFFIYFSLFFNEFCRLQQDPNFSLKNGPTPASFSFIFGLFKQISLHFLQQIYVKKCPSSIWYQDSNPQPSECVSLPITTRPGLLPINKIV